MVQRSEEKELDFNLSNRMINTEVYPQLPSELRRLIRTVNQRQILIWPDCDSKAHHSKVEDLKTPSGRRVVDHQMKVHLTRPSITEIQVSRNQK